MLDYQLVQLCKDNRKESKATTANRRAMFRLFAKQLEEKVLTSPLKACNIMQVGGRQREHSTADNDETNEAKLLRKRNLNFFLTKQTR